MTNKRKQSNPILPNKKVHQEKTEEDFRNFYSNLVQSVLNLKNEENTEFISDPFLKLPSKKQYPDYYLIINNPISISDIQRKIAQKKYSKNSLKEFLKDFYLLHDNATKYNHSESLIVLRAKQILNYVNEEAAKFQNNDKAKKSFKIKIKNLNPVSEEDEDKELSLEELYKMCFDLINNVINKNFPEIGVISEPFLEMVDLKKYYDYLKYVKKPMSFNEVLKYLNERTLFKSNLSLIENLMKFYDNIKLIFINAQTYNHSLSQIYEDSVLLNNYFEEKFEALKNSIVSKYGNKNKNKIKLKLNISSKENLKINLKLKNDKEQVDSLNNVKSTSVSSKNNENLSNIPKKEDEVISQNKKDVKFDKEIDNNNIKIENREIQTEEKQEDVSMVNSEIPTDSNSAEKNDLDQKNTNNFENEKKVKETVEEQLDYEKKQNEDHDKKNDISKEIENKPLEKILENFVIKKSSVSTSIGSVNRLINYVQQRSQVIKKFMLFKHQDFKRQLFSGFQKYVESVFFEYKFLAVVQSTQSYCVTLSPDIPPFISFKIFLHNMLYNVITSNTQYNGNQLDQSKFNEFKCKLIVNNEEVTNSLEFQEEITADNTKYLELRYDFKLCFGLNVLCFECMVSKSLMDQIGQHNSNNVKVDGKNHEKKDNSDFETETTDPNVEKINYYIVCNTI